MALAASVCSSESAVRPKGKNHSVGTARQAARSCHRSLSPSPVGPDAPTLSALAISATVLTGPPDGMFLPLTMTRPDWP